MTKGRYGIHGGQYIPETLMNAVIELEKAYNHYKNDKEFNDELNTLLNEYAGRPSRLYYAARRTAWSCNSDSSGSDGIVHRSRRFTPSQPDWVIRESGRSMQTFMIREEQNM